MTSPTTPLSPGTAPQPPLAGLNTQKTTLLLYPDRLCGNLERYHPETRTMTCETLNLPLAELHTYYFGAPAQTPRRTIARLLLIAGILALPLIYILPLWIPLLCTITGIVAFGLLYLLIPIRLLTLQTATATYHLPIQWWEQSDTRTFLKQLQTLLA